MHADKIRRIAWRMARRAIEAGDWVRTTMPSRAGEIVEMANVMTTSLDMRGCLDDKYGEEGSLEVEIAAGYLAKVSAAKVLPTAPVTWYADKMLGHVRALAAAGLLSDADRARARVFEFDIEEAERARLKAEEAERERKRREEAERQERAKRKEAARKRLAEIEKEKEVAK